MYMYCVCSKMSDDNIITIGYTITDGMDGIINNNEECCVQSATRILEYNKDNGIFYRDTGEDASKMFDYIVRDNDISHIYLLSDKDSSLIQLYFREFCKTTSVSIQTAAVYFRRLLKTKNPRSYNTYDLQMFNYMVSGQTIQTQFEPVDLSYDLFALISQTRTMREADKTRSILTVSYNADNSVQLIVTRLVLDLVIMDMTLQVVDHEMVDMILKMCRDSYGVSLFTVTCGGRAGISNIVLACERNQFKQV